MDELEMIVQEGQKRYIASCTKICRVCNRKLSLNNFYKNNALSFNKDNICKTCSGERNKNYKRNVKMLKDI